MHATVPLPPGGHFFIFFFNLHDPHRWAPTGAVKGINGKVGHFLNVQIKKRRVTKSLFFLTFLVKVGMWSMYRPVAGNGLKLIVNTCYLKCYKNAKNVKNIINRQFFVYER